MLYTLKTILRRLRRSVATRREATRTEEPWWCDPLSHPQLRQMSQRQIADLPIDPRRIRPHC